MQGHQAHGNGHGQVSNSGGGPRQLLPPLHPRGGRTGPGGGAEVQLL